MPERFQGPRFSLQSPGRIASARCLWHFPERSRFFQPGSIGRGVCFEASVPREVFTSAGVTGAPSWKRGVRLQTEGPGDAVPGNRTTQPPGQAAISRRCPAYKGSCTTAGKPGGPRTIWCSWGLGCHKGMDRSTRSVFSPDSCRRAASVELFSQAAQVRIMNRHSEWINRLALGCFMSNICCLKAKNGFYSLFFRFYVLFRLYASVLNTLPRFYICLCPYRTLRLKPRRTGFG